MSGVDAYALCTYVTFACLDFTLLKQHSRSHRNKQTT